MLAANMMDANAPVIAPDGTLKDALEIFDKRGVCLLPVVDGSGRVSGVISRTSLMAAIACGTLPGLIANLDGLSGKKAAGFMDKNFASAGPEAPALAVISLFLNGPAFTEAVLVVDNSKRLLGVITPEAVLRRLCSYGRKNP